jgi:hypothetical protein
MHWRTFRIARKWRSKHYARKETVETRISIVDIQVVVLPETSSARQGVQLYTHARVSLVTELWWSWVTTTSIVTSSAQCQGLFVCRGWRSTRRKFTSFRCSLQDSSGCWPRKEAGAERSFCDEDILRSMVQPQLALCNQHGGDPYLASEASALRAKLSPPTILCRSS